MCQVLYQVLYMPYLIKSSHKSKEIEVAIILPDQEVWWYGLGQKLFDAWAGIWTQLWQIKEWFDVGALTVAVEGQMGVISFKVRVEPWFQHYDFSEGFTGIFIYSLHCPWIVKLRKWGHPRKQGSKVKIWHLKFRTEV